MKVVFDGILIDSFKSVKEGKTTCYARVLSDKDTVTMKVSESLDLFSIPKMSKCTFDCFMNFFDGRVFFNCVDLSVTAYADYKEV